MSDRFDGAPRAVAHSDDEVELALRAHLEVYPADRTAQLALADRLEEVHGHEVFESWLLKGGLATIPSPRVWHSYHHWR